MNPQNLTLNGEFLGATPSTCPTHIEVTTIKRVISFITTFFTLVILGISQSAHGAAKVWNNTSTDFNAAGSWTGGPPSGNNVARFDAAPGTQPKLSSSISVSGLFFFGASTFGFDLTNTTAEVLTLTGQSTTGSSGASDSTAAAIRADNTSGTNTIDVPLVLASSTSTSTFFQASGGTLVVNGAISGTGITLNLNGTAGGIFQLAGNNSYSGGTTLRTGMVLNINNASAIGSGALTIAGSGTTIDNTSGAAKTLTNNNSINLSAGDLIFAGTNDLSFGTGTVTMSNASRSVTVTGSGATLSVGGIAQDATPRNFTKLGTGTLILSGTSSYTGTTSVNGGTLLVNGTTSASSAVTVNNSGSTLGGTGTVGGTVLLAGGGAIINPGPKGTAGTAPSVGTLNTGALTLTGSSVFHFDASGTSQSNWDQLGVTGTITLGTTSTLEGSIASGLNFTVGQMYTLINNDLADAISGTFSNAAQGSTVNFSGYDFTVSYTGGTGNDLVLTAVPEPSTWLAAALAFGAVAYTQRRGLWVRPAWGRV